MKRPGFIRQLLLREDGADVPGTRYSPELRERAVRLDLEHTNEHPSQWAAIRSIAGNLGCTPEALRRRVRQAEARDA